MLPHPPGSRGGRVVAVGLMATGITCDLVACIGANHALPGTIVPIASSRGGSARQCAPTTFATNACAQSQFNVIEV